ncbi:MAG: hypothetical protein KAI17_17270 [Thiotrichaceae bacterium]|nr:hypothetical protein [Thiotrichaceae bacterium]
MNFDQYTKQITALQKESGEYAANIAIKGKQVQDKLTDRINKVDELLSPDSTFMLEIATEEQPIMELVKLI